MRITAKSAVCSILFYFHLSRTSKHINSFFNARYICGFIFVYIGVNVVNYMQLNEKLKLIQMHMCNKLNRFYIIGQGVRNEWDRIGLIEFQCCVWLLDWIEFETVILFESAEGIWTLSRHYCDVCWQAIALSWTILNQNGFQKIYPLFFPISPSFFIHRASIAAHIRVGFTWQKSNGNRITSTNEKPYME